jgi:hypothetical protein
MVQRQRSRKAAIAAVLLGVGIYNLTFLAVGGILFMMTGWLLMRLDRRGTAHPKDDHL